MSFPEQRYNEVDVLKRQTSSFSGTKTTAPVLLNQLIAATSTNKGFTGRVCTGVISTKNRRLQKHSSRKRISDVRKDLVKAEKQVEDAEIA